MKRMSRPSCRRHHVDVRNSRLRRLRAMMVPGVFTCLSHERANVGAGNADRSACHEWAVAQTGYDPTLVFAAQQYWISTPAAGASYVHPATGTNPAGPWGAMGNAERSAV